MSTELWLECVSNSADVAHYLIDAGVSPPEGKDWFDFIIDGAERLYRRTPSNTGVP